MKRVGVREFRDRATHYLAGDEVLAIERHGQPIGFYIGCGLPVWTTETLVRHLGTLVPPE